MRSTIDAAGRVVIPKRLRSDLGLTGGAEVEIREREGAIEIRPVGRQVRLDWDDTGRPVLRAPDGAQDLTDDDVRAALEEVRRWPRRE